MHMLILYGWASEEYIISGLSWQEIMERICSSWYVDKLRSAGVTYWEVV